MNVGRWRAVAAKARDAIKGAAKTRGASAERTSLEESAERAFDREREESGAFDADPFDANRVDLDREREESGAFDAEKRRSATRLWEAKKNEAEKILANSAEARQVVANLDKWAGKFAPFGNWENRTGVGGALDGVKTLFRALKATLAGEYRGFSSTSLVAMTAAALYCVAPIDAICDWIPGVGICDDLFVVAVALKAFAAETRTFRSWERTKAARALFAADARRLTAIERVVLCSGWQTEGAPLDEIVATLRPVFPNAAFEPWRWPSNVSWTAARDYVDGDDGVEELARATSSATEPAKIALIGHSLGARLTVRALARRTRRGETPVGAAFLMGAAVDADDPDLEAAARGVVAPLGNFFAAADRVLKYAYQTAEGKTPLGLRGAEGNWANYVDCEVSGDEEFWLEFGENAASAVALLGSRAFWVKFPLSAEMASKAMEASRHRFAQYATFFRSVFE